MIPENTNDGFATQSSYHRFVVRVFHDLASREQDKIRSPSSRPRRLRPQQRVAPPTRRTGQWLITVKTDVLELTINTNGGDIEQALLLAYPKTLKSTEPFQLLETTPQFVYRAQSGLTGRDGPDNPANGPRPLYNVDKEAFVLADGDELVIPLTYTDKAGNVFTKTFTLKRGGYAVNVGYSVQNASEKPLEVSTFGQLKQTAALPTSRDTQTGGLSTMHTFRGAAFSTADSKYEKYKFDTILDNENLNVSTKTVGLPCCSSTSPPHGCRGITDE